MQHAIERIKRAIRLGASFNVYDVLSPIVESSTTVSGDNVLAIIADAFKDEYGATYQAVIDNAPELKDYARQGRPTALSIDALRRSINSFRRIERDAEQARETQKERDVVDAAIYGQRRVAALKALQSKLRLTKTPKESRELVKNYSLERLVDDDLLPAARRFKSRCNTLDVLRVVRIQLERLDA